MSERVGMRAVVVLAIVVIAIVVNVTQPIRLGLDLRGGTQIVLEAQDTDTVTVNADVTERTLEVLRRRVDAIGVAEPTLQRSGDRRIIVELPGLDDPEQALEVIGRTAQLTFHQVLSSSLVEFTPEEPTDEEGTEDPAPEDTTSDTSTDGTDGDDTTPEDTTDDPETPASDGTTPEEAADDRDQATIDTVPVGEADPSTEEDGVDGAADDADGSTDNLVLVTDDGEELTLGPARVTGAEVSDAVAQISPFGTWQILLQFRGGGQNWATLTAEAACAPIGSPNRRVAVVLDDQVIMSPQVETTVQCGVGLTGGDTVVTGAFSESEAKDLALLIRAGALPVPVEVVEQRTVGPTLGQSAIDASVEAALIGVALTIIFLIAYYRLLGAVAAIALGVYALVSLAALQAINATLTLPGIAGFVLAVGMAVDGNILVFERVKEEDAEGRSLPSAVLHGFHRAWTAIIDSNVTTLIAAALLYFFASGGVRGFGVTLAIGVIVSMFTSLVVTRVILQSIVRIRGVRENRGIWGFEVGRQLRNNLLERSPEIIGRAKVWFTGSGIVVLFCITGIVTQGLNYGLDFTGGRLVEFVATDDVDIEQMRTELGEVGLPRSIVNRTGEGNVVVRTRELDADEVAAVDRVATEVIGSSERVREEFIGPTVGAELRRKALMAMGIALAAQLLYLMVRFSWNYASGAVVGLAHNVVILVGVFAWLGKDFDGVFIAALLTVVGYTVNDTVVIFDRVRERWGMRSDESLRRVANDAALETLPRTVNTGLSTLFVLLALWFLAGDTLADFALALLIGITVGMYTSVFISTPMAVTLNPNPAPVPVSARTSSPVRQAAGGSRSPVVSTKVAPVQAPTYPPRPRKQKRKGPR